MRVVAGTIFTGHLESSISDNGEGMPEDMTVETAASLGLTIVRILGEQLRGPP